MIQCLTVYIHATQSASQQQAHMNQQIYQWFAMMQQGQQWHEALAAQLEQVQAAEVEEQVQAAEVDGLTGHRLRQNARWLLEPSNRD